uniref:Uncharacterized protein n=1 Tax=Arundo donax TaxID=35708 RepID=A0A0A9D7R0_ARUDO
MLLPPITKILTLWTTTWPPKLGSDHYFYYNMIIKSNKFMI